MHRQGNERVRSRLEKHRNRTFRATIPKHRLLLRALRVVGPSVHREWNIETQLRRGTSF